MTLLKTVQKKQFAPKLYSHHPVAYILLRSFAFLTYFPDFTSQKVFTMAFMQMYDLNLNGCCRNFKYFLKKV